MDAAGGYSVIGHEGYFETIDLSGMRIANMYRMKGEIITLHADLLPGEFLIKRSTGLHYYDRNCRCREPGQDRRGTTFFDTELKRITHYQRYPQLIPFVGRNYRNRGRRLLLLAESHYLLKDEAQKKIDIKSRIYGWYTGNAKDLSWNDYLSTNTALLTNNAGVDFGSKAFRVYSNLTRAIRLLNSNTTTPKDILTEVCFMNFFQRPAFEEGESIDNTKQDNDTANATLREVINVLKPDYLFFISDKAFKAFDKSSFQAERVGHSPHPGCSWWNRSAKKYDDIYGKELFSRFAKSNQIF